MNLKWIYLAAEVVATIMFAVSAFNGELDKANMCLLIAFYNEYKRKELEDKQ